MVTDEERREVARKLRMVDVDSIGHGYELLEEVADCIGDEGVKYGAYERFAALLADLIEPSGYECVPGECLLNVRHDNDRSALLAMIEEMVEMFRLGAFTGEGLDAKWCRELHGKYARRIREALGVES